GTGARFQILNDPVDEPFAQRIQQELVARGVQMADAAHASTRNVLVLSNRTHLAWLNALETELREKDLMTVVVTAIGLSPTLGWLWKRQWIDFRRGASADASKRQPVLPVPETLIERVCPCGLRLLIIYCVLWPVWGWWAQTSWRMLNRPT